MNIEESKPTTIFSPTTPTRSSNQENSFLSQKFTQTAAKYQQDPSNFPSPESPYSNSDITQFVHQEARRANANELPNLSCELIDLTLESGYQSPWLLYDKAVSIRMIGLQKKALRILD